MKRAACAVCIALTACRQGAAPVAEPPPAAAALAKSFAPELTGPLSPTAFSPGDYAMSLTLSFETYPSMELRITEGRTGALQLSLEADGGARACLGSRVTHSTSGQYHYEPPERREGTRTHEVVRLRGLSGAWALDGGVVQVRFDTSVWSTCDLARASPLPEGDAALRCVAVAATGLVPARSLACEAAANSQLLDLELPMTAASRKGEPPGPIHSAPHGRQLVLSSPGVVVTVEQDSHAAAASITFRPGAVKLDEKDYQPARK